MIRLRSQSEVLIEALVFKGQTRTRSWLMRLVELDCLPFLISQECEACGGWRSIEPISIALVVSSGMFGHSHGLGMG